MVKYLIKLLPNMINIINIIAEQLIVKLIMI